MQLVELVVKDLKMCVCVYVLVCVYTCTCAQYYIQFTESFIKLNILD